jgi:hypothetical protein
MMQKRKLSSLLLISFIVVFAFSYAAAQNTVTYETKDALRCAIVNQNVTASNDAPITGVELVFVTSSGGVEASGLSVTPGPDLPGCWYFDVDYSRVDGTAPDTVRVIALRLVGSCASLPAGAHVVAVLHYTTNDVCSGSITVSGAEWIKPPPTCPVGTIETQFVDDGCSGAGLVAVVVNPGTVTVANALPGLNPIANMTVHWGDPLPPVSAVGTDDDLPNGCERLDYSLTVFPTGMTINNLTGAITWNPVPGANVCENAVTVQVEDSCNATATTSFEVCVENDAPAFTCEDPTDVDDSVMCPGDLRVVGILDVIAGQVTADDPDDGPNPMEFTVINWIGPGPAPMPVMDPNTGAFTWTADVDPLATSFVYEMVVQVTDNADTCYCAPENSDTASYFFEVVPLRFYIQKKHEVPQGQFEEVSIVMPDNTEFINRPIGGFEFLIQYDASALTLMEVIRGDFIYNCGWEYFTYRFGPFGNCGNACPSGMLRIVGLAEYNNGPEHPECFDNIDGFYEIARMKYLVSNDRTLECMFVPIRFIWLDCNDNSVSDQDGTRLYIVRRVYDYVGDDGLDTYYEITDPTQSFPSIYGPEADCDLWVDSTKPRIYAVIDVFNGGIDIVCSKDIDDRGDINLDGVAYSIADAVMFSNYFIYGLDAFPDGMEDGSVAATDVNADGLTLSVGDLVYLIRVIVGDANPYDDPFLKPTTANYRYHNGVVSVEGDMGAAAFTFDGDVDVQLLADDMELKYHFDGEVTRAVVYSLDGNTFTGDVVRGSNMVTLELGSSDGATVVTNWLPSEFALNQNYPNPFNPATNVGFALPAASQVDLTIYNVTGQVVAQFDGFYEAGVHTIQWNAAESNASGIYFYKLTAGNFSETKKMVLLK